MRLKVKKKAKNNKLSLDNRLSLDKDLEYKTLIFNAEYNKESIRIVIYLIILKKLKDINRIEFYKFKKKALKYKVYK
jgi:hypothetical protein